MVFQSKREGIRYFKKTLLTILMFELMDTLVLSIKYLACEDVRPQAVYAPKKQIIILHGNRMI